MKIEGKLFKQYNEFYFQQIINNELGITASTQDGEYDYKLNYKRCEKLIKDRTEIEVSVLIDICGHLVYAVPEIRIDENDCIFLKEIKK